MRRRVSVSFLSGKKICKDILKIDESNADLIHVDSMDGKFVSSKYKPYRKLLKLSKFLNKRLDVHLMVNKPEKYIHRYATLNTEYITIHAELGEDVDDYLDLIKSYGIKCGLSINPESDISILENYLERIDLVLVMSVNPGRGGQSFIEDTYEKVKNIKKMISLEKLNTLISVDGGINSDNVKKLKYADIVVSGSYILNSENCNDAIESLR